MPALVVRHQPDGSARDRQAACPRFLTLPTEPLVQLEGHAEHPDQGRGRLLLRTWCAAPQADPCTTLACYASTPIGNAMGEGTAVPMPRPAVMAGVPNASLRTPAAVGVRSK